MSVRSPAPFRVSPKWMPYVVSAVVLVAAIVRLWGILGRGIYYHDEAAFLASGRFHGGLMRFAVSSVLAGRFSSSSLFDQAVSLWMAGGNNTLHARPLHEVSLILLTALLGSVTYAGPLLSALAGAATVLLLAMTGRKQSRLSGVLAAMLLAVSVWHTHYSRSALSQALSLLSVCAVMYVLSRYQQGERHDIGQLRWIGLLTGLAFASHYNLFWLPLLVGAWLAWNEWQGLDAVVLWLRRLLQVVETMLLPLVLFEFFYRAVPYTDAYVGQLIHQLGYTNRIADVAADPTFILKALIDLESMPFVLCLLAGLLYLIWRAWRKDRLALLLLLWALLPGLIWTVFGFPAPRSFLPMLPPLLLGAGLLVEGLCTWFRQKHKRLWPVAVLVCTAFGFVLAGQLVRLQPVIQARSPWRAISEQIIAYRDSHPGSTVDEAELALFPRPIYRYYLQETVRGGQTGGNLFIVDFFARQEPTLEDKILRVESLCMPVASISGDLGAGIVVQEVFTLYEAAQYYSRPAFQRIDVYDLERCAERER